ncbi:Transcription factor bHLH25 like [Actinidia chinensis var. chinensis]|uniref:Transcription factor bHLH25 like n=1 Tax=Actinidia chinensis var. chinensis TaxID=1590841 RepID=A0A2R6R239_ACTCC|nr:Transcription factor bHLH25 like [Actinidia chinensis var. chinensis]
MDDSAFIHQWPINSLDELSMVTVEDSFEESFHNSFSHPLFSLKRSPETSLSGINQPSKMQKTISLNSSRTHHVSNLQANCSPNQVPFANSNYANQFGLLKPKEDALSPKSVTTFPSDTLAFGNSFGNQNYVFKSSQGAKRISTNPNNQEHILAERKRREKLSQRFIALSAIIPGLKKMDKATVLEDAIKYLKQLQDQVKTLEEQTKKKPIESAVFVRKYELCAEGEKSSLDENLLGGPYDEPLPEIEARICEKNVLIKIHCEKRKGVLEKTIVELEKFHLSIANSSVLTFGSSALNITVVAQMEVGFTMTVKDLVKHLHASLKLFI